MWREIEGYEGQYAVSDKGEVKSLERDIHYSDRGRIQHREERLLKPFHSSKGYLLVKLNGKNYQIHRLVAQAFIPNPDNLPEVDHFDTCRTNNDVSNLRWITHKDNCKHSYDMGNYYQSFKKRAV